MPPDGLEALTREECMGLLASAHLGRVGVSIRALPAILPVYYALLDDQIVFRSGTGTKLAAAARGTIVAFEADGTSVDRTAGWSVLAVGTAQQVTDPAVISAAEALDLPTWSGGEPDHLVIVNPTQVSGRRFGLPPP